MRVCGGGGRVGGCGERSPLHDSFLGTLRPPLVAAPYLLSVLVETPQYYSRLTFTKYFDRNFEKGFQGGLRLTATISRSVGREYRTTALPFFLSAGNFWLRSQ